MKEKQTEGVPAMLVKNSMWVNVYRRQWRLNSCCYQFIEISLIHIIVFLSPFCVKRLFELDNFAGSSLGQTYKSNK